MSKTISKIVSLMCSMCLIMSVCFTQSAYAMTETPASGSGITESDIPSNYKWLTASDFHSNDSEFGNTYNLNSHRNYPIHSSVSRAIKE